MADPFGFRDAACWQCIVEALRKSNETDAANTLQRVIDGPFPERELAEFGIVNPSIERPSTWLPTPACPKGSASGSRAEDARRRRLKKGRIFCPCGEARSGVPCVPDRHGPTSQRRQAVGC